MGRPPIFFWGNGFGALLQLGAEEIMRNIDALIEPLLIGMGYELVEVESSPKGRTIRVFIDTPNKETGVDVEDCATVSDQLSHVFLVEGVDYDRLEISSPGLDRVLNRPAHYKRFIGAEISVRLAEPVNGRANYTAVLVDADDTTIEFEFDQGRLRVAQADVRRARLVPQIDWSKK